ncbi:MANSC domain-containing protein 1-like [Hypanus sabinus]|uniref:MANSC domain-containing protein 1-like n=1 Tax=Hypanus sabinus TaxID=79690 RepID=UPI0028C44BF1|nr:MANSC domain-containing protein 1-like [Hypanus sabinus]XP_059834187.1 MANSC domain-containing protein 1-like [Hypanus sabinus]XP_059834189.1 MANSC domain-containing protein 1-like [Hypanus sabinus]
MIRWHSQSLPLLLLLMLTIHQGLSNQLACNYSTIVDCIIDIRAALAKGMKSLDLIHKRSKEECLEECCNGLPTKSRGYPCNFVTFHPTNKSSSNCYLFHCSEKDACPTIRLPGYNSYIIENDQTNVEILNTSTKNSQSREKSSNNGIPIDIKTSAPGLTLNRRTINIFPLTTIQSRVKQPMMATTFKAPMILLSTSSTKTTSSITQLPVKTTSSVTTKESTATSTLQNGLLLTFTKMVPTTVFPIIRPTQTRTAALPMVPSVTSMLTGTVLPTTTQAITTITTKPLATSTLQTSSAIQPTMTSAPPSTVETTSSQAMTTTILTNQPTATTLPITTDQPTTVTLPITTDQPTTTTLPITTDQPTTTTLPITTDQPTTTTLPITTDQPTTTTLPITTDQPTATTLPITTDQPTAATLPITTDQPTKTPLTTTTLATTTNEPTTTATLPTTTYQATTTTTLPTTLQTTPIPTTMTTTFPTTTAQPSMRTTPLIHQTSTTTPPTSVQTSTAQLKTALPETRPVATITTVSARKLDPTVTQQPAESRNSAAKTPFFRIVTAVSHNGNTNKKDDEEKDPRQNLGGQNESAGKFGDSQMEIKGGLITALLFGLFFLTIVIVMLSKQVIESYRRRHYTKMDFVMNGIYVDA